MRKEQDLLQRCDAPRCSSGGRVLTALSCARLCSVMEMEDRIGYKHHERRKHAARSYLASGILDLKGEARAAHARLSLLLCVLLSVACVLVGLHAIADAICARVLCVREQTRPARSLKSPRSSRPLWTRPAWATRTRRRWRRRKSQRRSPSRCPQQQQQQHHVSPHAPGAGTAGSDPSYRAQQQRRSSGIRKLLQYSAVPVRVDTNSRPVAARRRPTAESCARTSVRASSRRSCSTRERCSSSSAAPGQQRPLANEACVRLCCRLTNELHVRREQEAAIEKKIKVARTKSAELSSENVSAPRAVLPLGHVSVCLVAAFANASAVLLISPVCVVWPHACADACVRAVCVCARVWRRSRRRRTARSGAWSLS